MKRSNQLYARRNGVTLIELLVVATIMLTLAAVSVPTIKPMMESQATSHAARVVSTYLERAKARAMTNGRACGVTFEYFPGTYNGDDTKPQGSASLVLHQVEEPPFYSGMELGATVSLTTFNATVGAEFPEAKVTDPNSPYYGRAIAYLMTNDAYWTTFVRPEEDPRIQFNSVGPYYPIYFDGSEYAVVKLPGVELPMYKKATFKVVRGPRPTMTAPIGLSQGSVIDLEWSGTDSSEFALGGDVTVMFSPNGEVEYVGSNGDRLTPSGPLYFLVGRWDRISALGVVENEAGLAIETAADDGLWNYEDGTNFWISINPRTGVIATTEVNQPFGAALGQHHELILESRDLARFSKRNLGGH